ncbi:MAG: FmdB family zinc ribbon protein [Halanaerobiaceae bacterium]
MPTYLYECEECGRFEKLQKISDSPLEECPECGSDVKKLIGSPGIRFKGSGFYVNDRKKKRSSGSKSSSSSSGNKEKVS